MKILIACEESQVECIAFRKAGHEAYSCDLQECSGGHPEWHIQGDALSLINGTSDIFNDRTGFYTQNGEYHLLPYKWDMIIAHPPCTYLALSSAPEYVKTGGVNGFRHVEMLKAVDFFMAFLNADCEKICVENPRVMARCGLPPHSQMVSPHEFGSDYSKRTCYWLKGLPPLIQGVRTLDYIPCTKSKWYQGALNFPMEERRKQRSKSFPEIAEAMAQQWG